MRIHYTTTVWHAGFYRYFINALTSLGHEVRFFDESGTKAQITLKYITTRLPGYLYKGENIFRASIGRDWLKSIKEFKPDLIIIQHSPNLIPDAVREAKNMGYKIFYWEDAQPANAQGKDVLASLEYVDKLFSVDREWMTILYNQSDFIHLPLAGEPSVFKPLPGVEKEYDVVFVGSFAPMDGDGYLRAKLVSNVPDKFKVKVFGNGLDYWVKYLPNLRNRSGGDVILNENVLNEIYNKSRIVLNIHAVGHESSLSARTYEIGLSGAFQLVDWRGDADIVFPPGMLVTFKHASDINGLIEKWLADPDGASRKAEEIRQYILVNHTWRHRAEKMLSYYKK
ncbi:MAG: glycosyltransferase [Patescibacteria group bacterium]|nr:glycosyltransferase [Patescibacteria group bacterium]MDE2015238.1 glycosyltransferase [Patescibacteria group bacterium]MDE2227044.1 glycosyltransferase [Patescibacteria group bacterium]